MEVRDSPLARSKPGDQEPSISLLRGAFNAFAEPLRGHAEFHPAETAWRDLAEDVDRPPMIAVMGHFKAGKSTFLNALLGESLLCADVLPATASVTVLTYGPERRLRAFLPDLPPLSLPFEKLREISSEAGQEWVSLRERMSYLEVTLPVPLLKQVTLVDTPGLNSVHGLHGRVTAEFVARADAIVWLFACPQVGTKSEVDEIRKLPPGCRPYAVVNQIDLLDPDEQPVEDFLEDVGRRLGPIVHAPIGISAKSAVDAQRGGGKEAWDSSGFTRFVALLEQEILADGVHLKERRLIERVEVALSLMLGVAEPALDEIRSTVLAMKQGKEYEKDIRRRIQDLSVLAQSWQPKPGTDPDRLILNAPTLTGLILSAPALTADVGNFMKLNQGRAGIIGVIDGVLAEKKTLLQEGYHLDVRIAQFRQKRAVQTTAWAEYNKSGFFGGPPIMFKGGKQALELEEATLEKLWVEIAAATVSHDSEVAIAKSRSERLQQECIEFIAEAYDAIMAGLTRVQYELDHRIEAQAKALLNIKQYLPLRAILRQVTNVAAPKLEKALRECAIPPAEQRLIAITDSLARLRICTQDVEDETRAVDENVINVPRADKSAAQFQRSENAEVPWGMIELPFFGRFRLTYVTVAVVAIVLFNLCYLYTRFIAWYP